MPSEETRLLEEVVVVRTNKRSVGVMATIAIFLCFSWGWGASSPSGPSGRSPPKKECSKERDALALMKFVHGIDPLPRGWGELGLCEDAWRGVTCTTGCVTAVNLSSLRLRGTADLTLLPRQ
eukprot:Hpha_TRINITY_DN22416_c0_g1::TRINITY_DN22416_c0_g1_i1::g.94949::m.94949